MLSERGAKEVMESRPEDEVGGPEKLLGNAGVRGDLQWLWVGSSGVELPAERGP